MHWTRRQLLSALAGGGAAVGAAALGARRWRRAPGAAVAPARESAGRAPNLLLVVLDDVGREGFVPYGGNAWTTPVFDRLAAEGLRFDHLYSTPLCGDSRGQIRTGRYAFRTGIQRFPGAGPATPAPAGPDAVASLPALLRERGYATGFAGKSHLPPQRRADPTPESIDATMRERGWDRYAWAVHTLGRRRQRRYWGGVSVDDGELLRHPRDAYLPDHLADRVTAMLGELPRPFFVQYSLLLAHRPFQRTPLAASGRTPSKVEHFPEMMRYLDHLLGRAVDEIDRLGLARDTLVFVVSDNGTDRDIRTPTPSGAVPGGKGRLTDAGTRVPALARWPGVVQPGVHRELIDLTDLLPTFLELADGAAGRASTPPPDLDGHSFAPVLRGGAGPTRAWHFNQLDASAYYIRTRRWKLYGDGRLFDVERDPAEREALRAAVEPAEAAEARGRLDGQLARLRAGPVRARAA